MVVMTAVTAVVRRMASLGSVLYLTAMVRVLFLIASFLCPLSSIISRRNEIFLLQRKGSVREGGVLTW